MPGSISALEQSTIAILVAVAAVAFVWSHRRSQRRIQELERAAKAAPETSGAQDTTRQSLHELSNLLTVVAQAHELLAASGHRTPADQELLSAADEATTKALSTLKALRETVSHRDHGDRPAAPARAVDATEDAAPPTPPQDERTALVVDDNESVCTLVGRQLKGMGYRVHTAMSGHKAMAHCVEHGIPPLVLTDIRMPGGMDGTKLRRWILDRNPSAHVVLMSGVQGPPTTPGVRFLQKPFTLRDLTEVVEARTRLDASG